MIYVSFDEVPGDKIGCSVRFDTDFEAQALLAGHSMPVSCDPEVPMTDEATQSFLADLLESAAIAHLKSGVGYHGRA